MYVCIVTCLFVIVLGLATAGAFWFTQYLVTPTKEALVFFLHPEAQPDKCMYCTTETGPIRADTCDTTLSDTSQLWRYDVDSMQLVNVYVPGTVIKSTLRTTTASDVGPADQQWIKNSATTFQNVAWPDVIIRVSDVIL